MDDEANALNSNGMMLEHLGYTVVKSNNREEAIHVYENKNEKIDLVILDMIMPGVGGGEIYDRMKEINSKVKVLLSSGYSINSQAKEILDRGCDAFIQKPYNLQDLSLRVKKLLGEESVSQF